MTRLLYHKITLKPYIVSFLSAEEKRRIRIALATKKMNVRFYSFYTLTYDPRHYGQWKQREMFKIREFLNKIHIWSKHKFWRENHWINKAFNIYPTLSYIWRLEQGKKSGRWHYHILFSKYIPHRIVKMYWGQGSCWVKKVENSEKAKGYLNKYFNKSTLSKNGKYAFNLMKSNQRWEIDTSTMRMSRFKNASFRSIYATSNFDDSQFADYETCYFKCDRNNQIIQRNKFRVFGRSRDLNLDLVEKNPYEKFADNCSPDTIAKMIDVVQFNENYRFKHQLGRIKYKKGYVGPLDKIIDFHNQIPDPVKYLWIGKILQNAKKNIEKFDYFNALRKIVNYDLNPLIYIKSELKMHEINDREKSEYSDRKSVTCDEPT